MAILHLKLFHHSLHECHEPAYLAPLESKFVSGCSVWKWIIRHISSWIGQYQSRTGPFGRQAGRTQFAKKTRLARNLKFEISRLHKLLTASYRFGCIPCNFHFFSKIQLTLSLPAILFNFLLEILVDFYFLFANLLCQMHSRDSFSRDQKDNEEDSLLCLSWALKKYSRATLSLKHCQGHNELLTL